MIAAPWSRGDVLALANNVLDLLILILLVTWFTLDRCNIYFRKDKN